LGYFLGLVGIYRIAFPPTFFNIEYESKDLSFNRLLLDFFAKTNDLYVEKGEEIYKLKTSKITEKTQKNYHD